MKKYEFYLDCFFDIVAPALLFLLASIIFLALSSAMFESKILYNPFVGYLFLSFIPFGGVILYAVLKDNIEDLKEDYNKYYKNK